MGTKRAILRAASDATRVTLVDAVERFLTGRPGKGCIGCAGALSDHGSGFGTRFLTVVIALFAAISFSVGGAPLAARGQDEGRIETGTSPANAGDAADAADYQSYAISPGPDLVIIELQSVKRWAPRIGDITAYSIGTAVCNVGDEWVNWTGNSNEHPVLAQNLYRLKSGRFEQIGMSWAKHGSFPGSGTLCSGPEGCMIDLSGRHLGVGCSDILTSEVNGGQGALGPRSQVNAATGEIEWPFTAQDFQSEIDRRLQVHDADLDAPLNQGAEYFIEGLFIAADEAAAGNELNSAAHREAVVTETSMNVFQIAPAARTQRDEPAIMAWQRSDPEVVLQSADVPGDGRFILACKVTAGEDGTWHYEYALYNFNSDRSARRFFVPVPQGVDAVGAGFHDIDYHSGSPYGSADWTVTTDAEGISWETDEYNELSPYANALRWGTLYNFRFESDSCPVSGAAVVDLYKPGEPAGISIDTVVPGPAITLLQSDPPNGAVDARQPFEMGRSIAAGWEEVTLQFSGCASDLLEGQFAISHVGPGPAPEIEGIEPAGDNGIKVRLTPPIPPSGWTTVTHVPTGIEIVLGFLPSDVDGDGTSSTRDLVTLIDAVTRSDESLPLWSADIDRSTEVDLGDIIRLIDLLTGAGNYDPYLSTSLP